MKRNSNVSESNLRPRMLLGPQLADETYQKAVSLLNDCKLYLNCKYLTWFFDVGGSAIINTDINSCEPKVNGYKVSITFRYVDNTGGRNIKVIKIADSDITNSSVYEQAQKELENAIIDFKKTLLNS